MQKIKRNVVKIVLITLMLFVCNPLETSAQEEKKNAENLAFIFEKLLDEEEMERECFIKDVDSIFQLVEKFKDKCPCKLIEV